MATSKFTLAMGLMQVAIKLVKLSDEKETSFKQTHEVEGCGGLVGRKMVCKKCGKDVPKEEVGIGYLVSKDNVLPFTKEERNSLHPTDVPKATISVVSFIDPLPFKWFKGGHYAVTPQDSNILVEQTLKLLFESLHSLNKVALVKYVDLNKEYVATINSQGILSHIFYSDEVENEDVLLGAVNKATPDARLVPMFSAYVQKVIETTPVNPATDIKNLFREAVQARVIEKQEKGVFSPMVAPVLPKIDPAKSLFDILSASITTAGVALAPVPDAQAVAPVAEIAKPKKAKKKVA